MSTSLVRGQTRPWCTFRLAGDLYGLDVLLIREVALLPVLTPVPHAPLGVLGCVNLRGQIHLVLDLRRLLGRGPAQVGGEARLILFKADLGDPFGIVVEDISGIVEVPAEQIEDCGQLEDLEQAGKQVPAEEALLLGVARLREELLLLLDARRLLPSLHRMAEEGEGGL
jgi:purine-binding chemotaxis protein CheW